MLSPNYSTHSIQALIPAHVCYYIEVYYIKLLLILSFNKHLMSTYSVPDIVLNALQLYEILPLSYILFVWKQIEPILLAEVTELIKAKCGQSPTAIS